MARRQNLIGVAPAQGAEALAKAMTAAGGPPVTAYCAGAIAILAEPAELPRRRLLAARGRAGLLRSLHRLQRRFEIGCVNGPFLAFDPAAADCAAADLPRLVAASADALADALHRDGSRQQWDIILRWSPEAVLAPQRETLAALAGRDQLAEGIAAVLREARACRMAALRTALTTQGIALAADPPTEGDTEIGVTALVPRDGEALIEAAFALMPPEATMGASADLRGPLPPISFAPLRVTALEAAAVDAAWRALDLPEQLDAADLTRRWREIAVRLHPDQAGAAADPARLDAAGQAYRLLRGIARDLPDGRLERSALRARSGPRLSIPAEAA
jgi:hypothetical protein